MDIFHHVAFHGSKDPEGIVESLGVKHEKSPLPGGHHDNYLVSFDIYESDPRWPRIEALIQEKGAVHRWETIFTEEEILAADWVRLSPLLEQGYPQPENSWEKNTYENECPRCGAGYRQIAPFHLRKEPHLGKNDFLSLLWTWTVFCTPKVLELLKENDIRGYDVWPAIIHRTKEPTQTVSQLVFPFVTEPGLEENDKHIDESDPGMGTCRICGITKYAYHDRGYMHISRQALLKDVDFQLTYEWFGSAHMAFREVLISNRLAKIIVDNHLGRVLLKPLELV